jgi:thioredoxin-dependent peroxiredoxin
LTHAACSQPAAELVVFSNDFASLRDLPMRPCATSTCYACGSGRSVDDLSGQNTLRTSTPYPTSSRGATPISTRCSSSNSVGRFSVVDAPTTTAPIGNPVTSTASRVCRAQTAPGQIADGPPVGSVYVMTRLAPGDAAPDFALEDADGKTVALDEFRGRKVVVYFYPAAMTPGCTKQACDFRDNLASLTAAGYAVLGVSPDMPEKLAKFRDRDAITFPLLSDPTKQTLQAYGAFGEKTMYGKKVTGVIRSTFVVDEAGKIEIARYNVKATGHVAMLRRDLGIDE